MTEIFEIGEKFRGTDGTEFEIVQLSLQGKAIDYKLLYNEKKTTWAGDGLMKWLVKSGGLTKI